MAWGVLNQSYGAAFVFPLYCLVHLGELEKQRFTRTIKPDREPTIESWDPIEAEALVYTSAIFAITPAWLLYPAFAQCSTETRQFLIASYRATPFITAIAQPVLATLIRRLRTRPLAQTRSRYLVRLSLIIATTSAALGHACALAISLLHSEPSLVRVFSPWSTVIAPPLVNLISQGCHQFLQNDIWIIAAALVPYSAQIVSTVSNKGSGNSHVNESHNLWSRITSKISTMLKLSLLCIVASPGAVLPWAMIKQEQTGEEARQNGTQDMKHRS